MCMLPCVFCIGIKVITSMDVVCIVGLCGGDVLGLMALLPQFLCLKNFMLYIYIGGKVWWRTSANKLSLCLDFIIIIIIFNVYKSFNIPFPTIHSLFYLSYRFCSSAAILRCLHHSSFDKSLKGLHQRFRLPSS